MALPHQNSGGAGAREPLLRPHARLDDPEIDGVTRRELNPTTSGGGEVYFGGESEYVDPDPGHSIGDIYEQVLSEKFDVNSPKPTPNPSMNRFAKQAEAKAEGMSEMVINGFRAEAVPVYGELVGEFAVFERGWGQYRP